MKLIQSEDITLFSPHLIGLKVDLDMLVSKIAIIPKTLHLVGHRVIKIKISNLKLRLLKETNYLPQLAIGLRDFAGTGLFSSEYLTSSKRLGNFDFTLGIGFGYLSSADDNIDNPLSFLKSEFKERPGVDSVLGGDFNNKTWFRGRRFFFWWSELFI